MTERRREKPIKTRHHGVVYQQLLFDIDPDHRPKPPVSPKRKPPPTPKQDV